MPVSEPLNKRQVPNQRRVWSEVDEALRYVIEQWRRGDIGNPLYIFGPEGTGKTSAALCVADTCRHCLYWTMRMLCETKFKAMRGDLYIDDYKVMESGFYDRLESAQLLIVDEVAKRERASDAEIDILHELLSRRQHKPTILIGNRPPNELARVYDGPVASRINCGSSHLLEGGDRRKGEIDNGERHKDGWKKAWVECAEPAPSVLDRLIRIGDDGTPEVGNVYGDPVTRLIHREWKYKHYKRAKWFKLVDHEWQDVRMPDDWQPAAREEYDEVPF